MIRSITGPAVTMYRFDKKLLRIKDPQQSTNLRSSIDPELMIRMLIVGYCYCIRFERKLWTRSSAR
jgi:hypothetical protein